MITGSLFSQILLGHTVGLTITKKLFQSNEHASQAVTGKINT